MTEDIIIQLKRIADTLEKQLVKSTTMRPELIEIIAKDIKDALKRLVEQASQQGEMGEDTRILIGNLTRAIEDFNLIITGKKKIWDPQYGGPLKRKRE